MSAVAPRRGGSGLFWAILAALAAGILTGLFFGPSTERISFLGAAYVSLLRMSVLPYIVVELIVNFGRLTLRQGRRLLIEGGCVLACLWALGLFNVWAFAQALPDWQSGSFFSSPAAEEAQALDFIGLFIPANVFAALSDGIVPAVVTFCVALGIALAVVPNRDVLIAQLDVLAKALTQINHFIVRLTPLGVFALSAEAAGTLTLAEIGRLQAYIIMYAVATAMLTFVVLPGLIAAITPLRYRDVLSASRDALLTALATGKLLIVLPLLIESTEQLFRDRLSADEQAAPAVDVLYPLAYAFPHLGKLLSILFIPFAAWFLGDAMTAAEYPVFLLSGLGSSFGGPLVSTPFLLDLLHLPRDMFQLFLLSGVICGRLGDMLGVMHLVTFAVITTCLFTGQLRWRAASVLKFLVLVTLFGLGCLTATRGILRTTLKYAADREELVANLQLLAEPVKHTVLTTTASNPEPLRPHQSLLSRIRERRVIRVGYNADKLPFAYFNVRGDLVGFDINLAHELAKDLGVGIEFVPFDRQTLADQLRDDDFDVVMSGLVGTLERSEAMMHTRPYLDVTLAFVVEDYRARSFASLDSLRELPDLKIGFVDLSRGFVERLKAELPEAELIELQTNGQYFKGAYRHLDALLIAAENGSAFTLFHPQFEVVIPSDQRVSLPLFYAIGQNDEDLRDFLEHWIYLRQNDGTFQRHYDHWILGKNQNPPEPRWSILHNVLGWGR